MLYQRVPRVMHGVELKGADTIARPAKKIALKSSCVMFIRQPALAGIVWSVRGLNREYRRRLF
jgi:hypothetical protein